MVMFLTVFNPATKRVVCMQENRGKKGLIAFFNGQAGSYRSKANGELSYEIIRSLIFFSQPNST